LFHEGNYHDTSFHLSEPSIVTTVIIPLAETLAAAHSV